MQIGRCSFASADAELLVSMLPQMIIARGTAARSADALIGEEARAWRSAPDLVLQRLLDVMPIEYLRSGCDTAFEAGLMRGLADERLATCLRSVHSLRGHS